MTRGIRSAREWLALLDKPWEEVRAILLDESDEGQRLRQTDPFCGILKSSTSFAPPERSRVTMKIEDRFSELDDGIASEIRLRLRSASAM